MGLDAQVIAIGRFSQSVKSALEYDDQYYEDVEQGAIVITCVFECLTSDQSHKLAKAFGVGAMELGKHHLVASAANRLKLNEIFDDAAVTRFELLCSHGFEFYYLPRA